MKPEDLATLSRVAAPATSADGRLVAWQQTETDPVSFARSTGLWLIDTGRAAAPARRVADIDGKKETSPVFGRDGMLYFLGNAG